LCLQICLFLLCVSTFIIYICCLCVSIFFLFLHICIRVLIHSNIFVQWLFFVFPLIVALVFSFHVPLL
jgi:hypothetical protein